MILTRSGVPGGSTTQVQYNNAGAFSGITGATTNGTVMTLTAPAITGPVVLTEAVGSSGLTITGATQTASFPALSLTQTWNNGAVAFTGVLVSITNTASTDASVVQDWRVGGATVLQINKIGRLANPSGSEYFGRSTGSIVFGSGDTGANPHAYLNQDKFTVRSAVAIGWVSGIDATAAQDLSLVRDAANTLAQRNATTAQVARLYRTWTDASNYERLALQTGADYMELAAETAGTGTDNIDMRLTPAGTGNVNFPGGTLLKTRAALTNGAAAAAGTLLNAPTAGDPTKWIPINDNGTTRYIPAW